MSREGRPGCRLAALGIINALGSGVQAVQRGVFAGDISRLERREDLIPGRSLLVGAVTQELPEISDELERYRCRNNQLTLAALQCIEGPIAEAMERYGRDRVGIVIGTSTSGVSAAEDAIRESERNGSLAAEFHYEQVEFGGASGFVAAHLDARGPAYTLSTACSSGARALVDARALLEMNLCDAVIAGATDSLCSLTAAGFSSLGALSDTGLNCCSVNRDGTVLGEGSAIFLLERGDDGVQLEGAGDSSDAHHISAPDPSGEGALTAMRAALVDARLQPADISYVNLHGTGTRANDAMESAAVASLFGKDVPVSGTKATMGHTLGAAGAMDAAVCWMALGTETSPACFPPHIWDGARDADLPELALVSEVKPFDLSGSLRFVTNSFGFGGNNSVLVLSRTAG